MDRTPPHRAKRPASPRARSSGWVTDSAEPGSQPPWDQARSTMSARDRGSPGRGRTVPSAAGCRPGAQTSRTLATKASHEGPGPVATAAGDGLALGSAGLRSRVRVRGARPVWRSLVAQATCNRQAVGSNPTTGSEACCGQATASSSPRHPTARCASSLRLIRWSALSTDLEWRPSCSPISWYERPSR